MDAPAAQPALAAAVPQAHGFQTGGSHEVKGSMSEGPANPVRVQVLRLYFIVALIFKLTHLLLLNLDLRASFLNIGEMLTAVSAPD